MAWGNDLVVDLKLDTKQFMSALSGIRNQLSFGKLVGANLLGNLGAGLVRAAVGQMQSLGASFIAAGTSAVQMAADFESTAVSMEVLLKGKGPADEMLKRMQQFALETPFELMDVVKSGRTLMARGIGAENIIPMLRIMGDTASAMGGGQEIIDNITLAIAQIAAKGKLQAEELTRQLGQYIPAMKFLADHLGKTQAEVMEMLGEGEISAGVALTAIFKGMKENYGGTMEKQFQTLRGGWINFKEQIALIARDIGTTIITAFNLKGLVTDMRAAADAFRSEWLPLVEQVINRIGAKFQDLRKWFTKIWDDWLGEGVRMALALAANWELAAKMIQEAWGVLRENVVEWGSDLYALIKDNLLNLAEDIGQRIGAGIKQGLQNAMKADLPDPKEFFKFENFGFLHDQIIRRLATAAFGGAAADEHAGMVRLDRQFEQKPLFNFMTLRMKELLEELRKGLPAGGAAKPRIPEGEVNLSGDNLAAEEEKRARRGAGSTPAAIAFSREAMSAIARATNANSPAVTVAKKQLEEQKKTNTQLASISADLQAAPMLGVAVLGP